MKLSDFQQRMDNLNSWAHDGCGRNGCIIKQPSGMAMNGGCLCQQGQFSRALLELAADLKPTKADRYLCFEKP